MNKKIKKIIVASLFFSILTLSKLLAATPNTPINFDAEKDLQVELTWTLDGGDNGTGVWEIKYTTATDATSSTAEHEISSSGVSYVAGSTITYKVSNLIPHLTYYFWVRVRDDANWSSYTSSMSAVADIFSEISDFAINALNYSSIDLGDYDNDGDLDIAIIGDNGSSKISKVYRNDSGTFVDLSLSLEGVYQGDIKWGDYDSDGDLDLILSGRNNSNSEITKIYRNDAGSFTDINASLVGLKFSSPDWGDYDNDGDLDLIITGNDGSNPNTKLYRNDGYDTFTEIETIIEDLHYSGLEFGDYDNDGDLDLIIAGWDSSYASLTKIYNNTNGTFSDSGISLINLNFGFASWGDYDNDGDLDLAISGRDISNNPVTRIYNNNNLSFSSYISLEGLYYSKLIWADYDNDGDLDLAACGYDSGSQKRTEIYRNNGDNTFTNTEQIFLGTYFKAIAWCDYDNDSDLDFISVTTSTVKLYKSYESESGNNNTAPNDPSNLSLTYNSNTLEFRWNKATDTETSSNGLYYEIQVATQTLTDSLTKFIVSVTTGAGTQSFGNYPHSFVSVLQPGLNLTPTVSDSTYYFRVRTVDTSFGKSSWVSGPSVYIEEVVPTVPTLISPSNNYTTNYNTIEFTWNKSIPTSNVGFYELQISSDINFSIINHSSVTISTVAIITSITDNEYFWRVRTKNTGTSYTTWSSTKNFIVSVNTPLAPYDYSAATALQITLNFQAQGGNNGANGAWEIRYSTDSNATALSAEHTTFYPNINYISGQTYSLSLGGGFTPTTYYFFMRSKDNDGDWGEFTDKANAVAGIFEDVGNLGLPTITYYPKLHWGDYDNDGDLDLAVCGGGSPPNDITEIYRNDNGTFTDINAGIPDTYNSDLCWGDYDNDGDLDLALTGIADSQSIVKIYKNDNGTFTDSGISFYGVYGGNIAWGDYDNDGDLDLVYTGWQNDNTHTKIYKNDNGSFSYVTDLVGVYDGSISWGDYDNDGDLDLAIFGYNRDTFNAETRIYRNDSGTFTDINAGLNATMSGNISWCDYDSDGDLDLSLTGSGPQYSKIYRNDSGTFTDIGNNFINDTDASLSWGDYDNDGDYDLAICNRDYVKIYNNDAGTFTDSETGITSTGLYFEISWGDYDNDGDLDLIRMTDTGSKLYKSFASLSNPNTSPTAPSNLEEHYDTEQGIVEFTWDKGTDAQTTDNGLYYDIRLATNPTTGDPGKWLISPPNGIGSSNKQTTGNYSHGFVSSSTLQPGLNLKVTVEDTTYYWQTRSIDPSLKKGNWSVMASTFIPNIKPTVPIVVAPVDYLTTNYPHQTFDWNQSTDSITGVKDYQLQLSTDINFSWIYYSSVTTLTLATIEDITGATYYFRVRARDNLDLYGDFSSTRTFTMDATPPTIPVFNEPIADLLTYSTTLKFTWNPSVEAIVGVDKYELEISSDINFSFVDHSSDTVLTTATINNIEDQVYYYRARALDNGGEYSDWTTTKTFTVDTTSPTAISFTSPEDNLISTEANIEFTWTQTFELTFNNYVLEISSDINFSWIDKSSIVVLTTATIDSITDERYYARVKVIDGIGYITYTTTQTFIVDTTSPTVPVLTNPVDNLTTENIHLSFDWNPSTDVLSGISNYELIISTDINFGIINYSTNPVISTGIVTVPVDAIYYYKVRAKDVADLYSTWSTTRIFTMDAGIPTTPELTSVEDLLTTNYTSLTFHWNPSTDSAGISNYELEISSDIYFSYVDYSSAPTISTAVVNITVDNMYYVRVRAKDGVGTYGIYSTTRVFTVDTSNPTPGQLSAPVDNLTTNYTSLAFIWSTGSDIGIGLSSYELDLSTDINFGVLNYTSATVLTSANIGSITDDLYYTRVKTIDGFGYYSYSSTRSFRVDTTSPVASVITAPVDNLLTKETSITFNWNPAVDDTLASYELQVSSDIGFSNNLTSSTLVGETTSVISGLWDDSYYVRVKAVDRIGYYTYSATQAFTVDLTSPIVGIITSPVNNLATVATTLVFNWNPAVDDRLNNYVLEVSTDINFGIINKSSDTVVNYITTASVSGLTEATHYVRVKAIDEMGWYNYSSTQTFIVDQSSPTAAVITGPTDAIIGNASTEYYWNPSVDATLLNYELQMSTDIGFGIVNYSSLTVKTTATVSAVDQGIFYYRIKSLDRVGYLSYSSTQRITIDVTSPTVVNILKPLGTLTTDHDELEFVWEKSSGSAGIEKYELQISSDSNFASIDYSSTTVKTTATISNLGIETLYARVRAKDNGGTYADWSSSRIINRKGVMPPENFTGVALGTDTIKWSWTNISTKASGYGVKGVTTTLASNATHYEETGLSANKDYTSYAESYYNTDGSTGTSNSATVFTLANAPSGLSPSEIKKHSVILSWSGNGGKNYMIEQKEAAGSWEVVVGTVTEVTKKITHLKPATTYYFSVKAKNGNDIVTESSSTYKVVTLNVLGSRLDPTKENKEEKDLTLKGKNLKVKITIPAGTVGEVVYVTIDDPLTNPVEVDSSVIVEADATIEEGKKSLGLFLELNMYDLIGNKITSFDKKVTIEFPYSDVDQDGIVDGTKIPEESVEIYVLNETTSKWELVGGVVDTAANVVIAELSHFSVYTLISKKLASDNLDNVNVYPNPYKVGTGGKFDRPGGIMFKNLTAKANIRIYNIVGKLVYEYAEENGDGEYEWDTTNTYGKNLASGIYIYIIKNPEASEDKAKGKLGIIR